MLVGAAPQNAAGSDFPALNTAAGPWTIRRSYETAATGWPFKDWASCRAGVDVVYEVASLWSAKPDLVGLGKGTYNAAITAFVETIPDDHLAILSIWHEVDGKIRQKAKDPHGGVITAATWLAAFRQFATAVHAAGKPNVYTAALFEAWSQSHPSAGTTFTDLWPGLDSDMRPFADVLGIDGYSDTGTGEALWGPAIDWAWARDIPWLVHEMGCKGTLSTDWMSANATYLADRGALAIAWFSNDNQAVPTPGTDPAADACSQALSRAYYTAPAAFALR